MAGTSVPGGGGVGGQAAAAAQGSGRGARQGALRSPNPPAGHLQPMLHSVDAINARHPWTSREAIPHAGYHPYRRAWADQPGTERFGSNGSAINNPRTLLTYPDEWARDAAGRWTNTTSLDHIGVRLGMAEWAQFKARWLCGPCGSRLRAHTYPAPVHCACRWDSGVLQGAPGAAHGQPCVCGAGALFSRLRSVLLPPSGTDFPSQSGYTTYISRLLRPMVHMVPYWKYRPQELLDGIAWAQAHDDQARAIGQAGQALAASMLSPRGLRCFWLQLFHELAPLLRYDRSWTAPERMMAADAYLEAAKGWRNEKGAPVKSGVVTTAR